VALSAVAIARYVRSISSLTRRSADVGGALPLKKSVGGEREDGELDEWADDEGDGDEGAVGEGGGGDGERDRGVAGQGGHGEGDVLGVPELEGTSGGFGDQVVEGEEGGEGGEEAEEGLPGTARGTPRRSERTRQRQLPRSRRNPTAPARHSSAEPGHFGGVSSTMAHHPTTRIAGPWPPQSRRSPLVMIRGARSVQ